MKKILLSTVALAGLTAGATAADLPSRRLAPAPYVAVPVFTWTGFYVGVNAGYGFSDNNSARSLTAYNVAGANAPLGSQISGGAFGSNNNRDGFVGGGQVGYNYQMGNFVIGLEGDIQYTDFGNNRRGSAFATYGSNGNLVGPANVGSAGNVAFFNNNTLGANRSDFFGTVRGRIGYAMDRVLVYGTGGAAFRDLNNNTNNGVVNGSSLAGTGFYYAGNVPVATVLGSVVNPTLTRKADDVGYVVGAGVEYAFTPQITGKIEGMYVNFGRAGGTGVVGVTNTGSAVVSTTRSRDDDFAIVRAGVNYKFNLF